MGGGGVCVAGNSEGTAVAARLVGVGKVWVGTEQAAKQRVAKTQKANRYVSIGSSHFPCLIRINLPRQFIGWLRQQLTISSTPLKRVARHLFNLNICKVTKEIRQKLGQ